ncbi:type VII secretion protein EccE [Streptacidiphilus cavernicola]|uniref:Type VII secretion protein EccE n=1 Tax=Streptacidiphilus cavernicola TaxID=3342716 RepID=A0ABV6W618_9ACTN
MPSQTVPPRAHHRDGPSPARGSRRGAADRAPVADAGPVPSGPVQPSLRPRPGLLGPLRLPQLVLVETAAALVVIGLATNSLVLAPCGAVAVLLVLLALIRRNGLSVPQLLRARSALKARQRRIAMTPPDPETDPAMAPALECDPALRTVPHTVEFEGGATTSRRDRREIGMIGDGTFLSAVILVEAQDEPLRPVRGTLGLTLDLLADGLQVDDVTVDAIQVVQYSQTSPAPHLPEQALAARGYRELPFGAGTPGLRLTWVAVRLDPERCRSAVAARGGGEAGARKALQRATDQLASRMIGAGLRATVLDQAGVVAAVSTATCGNPLRTGGPGGGGERHRRTAETARSWRCDDRWNTSYWVGNWPRLAVGAGRERGNSGIESGELVNLLTGTPALGSTFSLTVRQASAGAVAVTGQVRVTARGESELSQVARQLETRARSAGVGLVRLDHEQIPGVLATLPLGGTR